MNVEQLIDTALAANGEIYSPREEEIFASGVRHAIAAMFEVVKEEDLVKGKRYWLLLKAGDKPAEWVPRLAFFDDNTNKVTFMGSDYIREIRRCPTPGEMGMGGV